MHFCVYNLPLFLATCPVPTTDQGKRRGWSARSFTVVLRWRFWWVREWTYDLPSVPIKNNSSISSPQNERKIRRSPLNFGFFKFVVLYPEFPGLPELEIYFCRQSWLQYDHNAPKWVLDAIPTGKGGPLKVDTALSNKMKGGVISICWFLK